MPFSYYVHPRKERNHYLDYLMWFSGPHLEDKLAAPEGSNRILHYTHWKTKYVIISWSCDVLRNDYFLILKWQNYVLIVYLSTPASAGYKSIVLWSVHEPFGRHRFSFDTPTIQSGLGIIYYHMKKNCNPDLSKNRFSLPAISVRYISFKYFETNLLNY